MSSNKTGYARYTFAFASDLQKLADEKRVKVLSFRSKERKSSRGSYDILEVRILVPRPDRDEIKTTDELETHYHSILDEFNDELGKDEVNYDEI